MDEYTFSQYLIDSYKEKTNGKTGYDVIDWSRDTSREDNIVYYYKEV